MNVESRVDSALYFFIFNGGIANHFMFIYEKMVDKNMNDIIYINL